MKKILFLGWILCLGFTWGIGQKPLNKNDKPGPQLRHVVMFKFQDKASKADIQKVVDAFSGLPDKIPQIKDFEWGVNNSPEKLNQGLTHCFLLSFASEADRDAYLIHPAHKAFGEVLKPYFDKATVLDYWVHK